MTRQTPLSAGPGPARRAPLDRTSPRRAVRAPRTAARPADPLPPDVRAAVYTRALDQCEICGVPLRAGWRSVQHRARRGSGGSTDPGRHRLSNLLAVCGPNASAGCHALADGAPGRYNHGWQVRRGDNPATAPVLYRGGSQVLLDDHGGIHPASAAA